MTQHRTNHESVVVGALLGGTALVGGILFAVAAWPRAPRRLEALPSDSWQTAPTFTEADVEAAARMLASENPRGSRALHIEQIHTQLRARKLGQSLFDRISSGSGWGLQGERRAGGGMRPVSTVEAALAREVLAGVHPSIFIHARKFFEPAQQDRAFAAAERSRKKQAAGQALTPAEKRLLAYRHSAADIRNKWRAEGAKYVGTIDGVEFYG
jgi:hypothetical protein